MLEDLRFTIRGLRREPGHAAAAILTLALGIGCTSAIFSVIEAVLLRGLPLPQAERLVALWEDQPKVPNASLSGPDFRDMKADARSYESLSAYLRTAFRLTGLERPERVAGAETDASFFAVLRTPALLGRVYGPASSGEAVLSERLWRRVFGADPAVIGKTITVNGEPRTVVGVIPSRAAFPTSCELWVSSPRDLPLLPGEREAIDRRGSHYLHGVARLRSGTTVSRAQAELDAIFARLGAAYPENDKDHRGRVASLQERIVGQARTPLLVLMAGVVLVLLIACANVGSLQLARAAARERDLAVRVALGASRWRIVRQLVVETMFAAVVSGALGVAASYWGVPALVGLAGPALPRGSAVSLNLTVVAFAVALSLATGIASGLVPALVVSRQDAVAALRTGAAVGAHARFRAGLVVAEVALATTLLAGAGLLLRSFDRLSSVDPGFQPNGAVVLSLSRPEKGAAEFFEELVRRAAALPGVRAAGAIRNLPMSGSNVNGDIMFEGRPAREGEFISEAQVVAGDYFAAMGIPLRRGAALDEQMVKGAERVAVVNETFARRFFPGEDALGKRFSADVGDPNPHWTRIVGIVGDVHQFELGRVPEPEIYYPVAQQPTVAMTLVVRSRLPLASLAPSIAREISALDPDQPVSGMETLADRVRSTLDQRRLSAMLLSIFSGGALFLTVVGLYATLAFSVAQRTREIGVRMALGARVERVVQLVVGQGMRLATTGVAIGVAAALVLGRLIASLLYGVGSHDAATFGAVVAVLLGSALIACWVPARRAARVDPVVALHAE
ncbi:MAG TPA: ABC transporter permease [Myxococcales bacterium]|nr:ABC transporter permease [Myxococcales bacterium]